MIDDLVFKSGMRRLAAGVSVVTTIERDVPSGIVATSVSSVCAAPIPSILVCVNRGASCHDVILRTGIFCVNILSAADLEIAKRFGSNEQRERRFEQGEWMPLVTGAPAFADALASFDCVLTHAVQVHSHTIVIGEVKQLRLREGDAVPLLYFDGRYEHLARQAS